MTAYYNDFDPAVCAWLEELVRGGHIAPGIVDCRSILDVEPVDLIGFTQVHFFAGIGGWSAALRLAGWPDYRPVWTGSPPCQPFSVASVAHGGARGQDDPRHLMPAFARLIGECKPATVFGEQVANAIKWGWLDETFGSLENLGYACAAAIVPALAVGASHERKRLFWVADASSERRERHKPVERIPEPTEKALPLYGDPLTGARHALAGRDTHLLPFYGVSVGLERSCAKGFGNAIVPQAAARFIEAFDQATGHVRLTELSEITTDNQQEDMFG